MLECACDKMQNACIFAVVLLSGLVCWLLLYYVAMLNAIVAAVSGAFVSLFTYLLRLRSEEPQNKSMTYKEALEIFECEEQPLKKAIDWTYKCKAKLYNEFRILDFYRIRLERLETAKIILLAHQKN